MLKTINRVTSLLVLVLVLGLAALTGMAPALADPTQTEKPSEAYLQMEIARGITAKSDTSGVLQFSLQGSSRPVPVTVKAGEFVLGSAQFPLQEGPFSTVLTATTTAGSKVVLRLEGNLAARGDKVTGQKTYDAIYASTYYDPEVLTVNPDEHSLVLTAGFASGAIEVKVESDQGKDNSPQSFNISVGLDRNNDGVIGDDEKFAATGNAPVIRASTPLYPVLPLTAVYEVKVTKGEEVLCLQEGAYNFIKGAQFTANESVKYPVTKFGVGFFRQPKVATVEMPNAQILKSVVSGKPKEDAGDWTRRETTRVYGPGVIPPSTPGLNPSPTPTPTPVVSPLTAAKEEAVISDALQKEPVANPAPGESKAEASPPLSVGDLWKPVAIGLGVGVLALGLLFVSRR